MTVANLRADEYTISCDRARLDVASIHAYLATSYWSPGIPREIVERGIEHSLPFGVYRAASCSPLGTRMGCTARSASRR